MRECSSRDTRQSHREVGLRLSSTRQYAAAAPGFLALLLPKCPMCWASILALLGIHSAFAAAVLYPIGFCCLAPAAVLLAIKARRHGGWGPFSLYSIAGVMLITGRLLFENEYLTGAGVLTMLAAVIWSGLPAMAPRNCACQPACAAHTPPLPHVPRIPTPRHAQIAGPLQDRAPIAKHRQLMAARRKPQRVLIRAHLP